jgi:RNA polymerase sigma-70 factor (ECF subfamily)
MKSGKEQTNARETFARLYDEHMPKVYRYIYYKVNDQQLAEDLTANVFEKALVNFAKYSGDRASFSTWIFAIARNTIADHYRAQPKVNMTSIDEAVDMPSRDPGPVEVTEDDEEKRLLRICITRLPQDEQEIVRLKFAMEMTNRDLARATGLGESNVGVKLYRIVRKLRESFQESQHG